MVRRSCDDAGQHRGALLDRALDARFHLEEGLRGAAHFARAAGPEVRRLAALAEAFGGVRQPQDRLDLVAQEQHRDDQQDRGGADHPEQEDLRIRGIGRAALGEDAHHGVVELDADFDQVGAADGVDPERLADLAAELHRERLVEQREERLRAGRRHVADGQEIDHQLAAAAGRCAAAARGPCPADSPCRRRSGWRCPAPPRPTDAASPCSSAAP